MKQQRHFSFCPVFWDFCLNFCSLLQAGEGKEALSVPAVIPQPSALCPEIQKQKETIQEVLVDFPSVELCCGAALLLLLPPEHLKEPERFIWLPSSPALPVQSRA